MGVAYLQELEPSAGGILQSDLEQWRQAGYAAINKLVDRLKDQIEGKDVEDISNLLREEGKNVTAAIFEQMINSLGKEELQAKTHACPECNKTLKSAGNLLKTGNAPVLL